MDANKQQPTILVVDDVPANLVAIETVLGDFDARLILASGGEAALEMLLNENQVPVMALLDVQMPGMDGYELASLLRSVPKTRQMPIVFLSAVYQDVTHITKGYDSGAIDFLVKPIDEQILRAKVRVFLELNKYRSQLEQTLEARTKLTQTLRQTADRLNEAQRIAKMGSWEQDLQNQKLSWSDEVFRLLELDASRFAPDHPLLLAAVHPEDRDRVDAAHQQASQASGRLEISYRLCFSDGRIKYIDEQCSTELAVDGKPSRLFVIVQDVTERKQAEEKLRQAASVFEYTNEGIVIIDLSGNILDVNRAFSQITGYEPEEVLGQHFRILHSEQQDSEFYGVMWQTVKQNGHWYGEVWSQRKSGDLYAQLLTISAVRDDNGQLDRYVALFSDITRMKEHQQQLEHIAHYDALTHLPNRLLLADRLQHALTQAKRYEHNVAVIYLDLDGFKAVNDTHGHEAGDYLLVQVSGRMKLALRDSDTLSRLGGDEFVAVLPNLADTNVCGPVLDRLLATVCEPVVYNGHELHVSASVGVSFYPQAEDDIDADQILRQADQAMYQAKQSGKNRYHIFDDEHDRHVRSRHASLEQIRQAIFNDEFVLFYQPKVNMRTGEVVGLEALVRWQHPERGMLAPAVFLPIIENHPLLVDLGNWVLRKALWQFEVWHQQGEHLPVSINIDGIQLNPVDFIELLQSELSKHPNVGDGDLQLEVLESSALDDIEQVSRVLAVCQQMGVTVALDDFGTGYSSLSYLKRLPVQLLKIDQSFVRDMLQDPDDLSIIVGILSLANAFKRDVIAEGVETEAHGKILLDLGCVLGQGYAISRPLPADTVINWVRSWRPPASWRGEVA